MGSAFVCSRGGAGGHMLIAECDRPGCRARQLIENREQYAALAEAGWRRRDRDVRCPDHAVDYQQTSLDVGPAP